MLYYILTYIKTQKARNTHEREGGNIKSLPGLRKCFYGNPRACLKIIKICQIKDVQCTKKSIKKDENNNT